MIDQETKQKILDAANIVEVVSDFVRLRKAGADYKGLCPFHSDRRPSFSVSPSRNICKCFSCGEGGSPIHFIMKHEQLSFTDALRYLAKKYHIPIQERELTAEEKLAASERESLFILNEYANSFFEDQLYNTEDGTNIAMSYFQERGIRPDIIKKFELGYAPDTKDIFTQTAIQRGFPLERLLAVGLSVQYDNKPALDRFRGRVIFPVRNLAGKYVAFGGRILGKSDKIAKYLNSPESLIYSKSRELYGLFQAKQSIAKQNKCYLVEGYTDVISMSQAGIENVVSSSGTALTIEQIRLLKRFSENITVLYDGDQAGIKAALRGIDLLLEEGLNIKVVLLPDGEDPDSFSKKYNEDELLAYLNSTETDFIHFKSNLFKEDMQGDPVRRAELIRDILQSIALIPDSIKRSVLIQSTAIELNINEKILIDEVLRIRKAGVSAKGYLPSQNITTPKPKYNQDSSPKENSQEDSKAPEEEAQTKVKETLNKVELDLLNFLILECEKPILIQETEENKEVSEDLDDEDSEVWLEYYAPEYIYNELSALSLLDEKTPLFKKILSEILSYQGSENEILIKNLMASEDEDINFIITDIITKDEMRRTLKKRLFPEDTLETINKLIDQDFIDIELEKKYQKKFEEDIAIERGKKARLLINSIELYSLMKLIRQVYKELDEAQKNGEVQKITQLFKRLQELNTYKVELSKILGERTIQFL